MAHTGGTAQVTAIGKLDIHPGDFLKGFGANDSTFWLLVQNAFAHHKSDLCQGLIMDSGLFFPQAGD
jgi:hypothetical protein